jgi:hypothetical protein
MNNKSNKRKIREALGLPSDTFKAIGVVADDSVSENTMTSKCGVRMCEHPKNTSLGEVRLAGGSHAGSEASRNEENCFGTDGNDADGLKAESAPQGSWDSAWEVEMEKQKRIQAENKFECLRYLDEKGLPLSLIDVIGEGSLEKMKGAIDSLLQIITSRVRDEVKSRLVSVTPPPSKTISPSYADFQKMSLGEMQKIYSTNRMLYNELTQNNKK